MLFNQFTSVVNVELKSILMSFGSSAEREKLTFDDKLFDSHEKFPLESTKNTKNTKINHLFEEQKTKNLYRMKIDDENSWSQCQITFANATVTTRSVFLIIKMICSWDILMNSLFFLTPHLLTKTVLESIIFTLTRWIQMKKDKTNDLFSFSNKKKLRWRKNSVNRCEISQAVWLFTWGTVRSL